MDQRKIRRHLKRIKETGMARLTAAFMLAVIILTLEISYVLSGASGKRAFANEAENEEVIVIPVNESSTQSGEKISGNESAVSENKAEEEPPSPVVKIGITEPAGWHRKSAEVKFSAEDIGDSGDFTIASVRAKIGNGGSWTDVTDSMSLGLSEDCVVYVEITDTKGRD